MGEYDLIRSINEIAGNLYDLVLVGRRLIEELGILNSHMGEMLEYERREQIERPQENPQTA